MDLNIQNEYVFTFLYYAAVIVSVILFLIVFEMVTKYKSWQLIRKGNVAVSMATTGKIFGVSNIFRFSMEQNDTFGQTLLWGAFGFLLLLAAYFIFEFLTPGFNVDEQIEKDNRAVGLLSMIISISLSYVIGASIM